MSDRKVSILIQPIEMAFPCSHSLFVTTPQPLYVLRHRVGVGNPEELDTQHLIDELWLSGVQKKKIQVITPAE